MAISTSTLPGRIRRSMSRRDQPGRLGARHQHRADEQVHRGQQLQQVRFVRVKRVGRVQRDVQEAHPLQVHLEDGHIRAHALGHARGVDAGGAAAQHDDLARQHARHAAQQHAAAAVMFGQKIAADQDGHAPGDLAHRLQQRQPAVDLDGLVGQAGHAAISSAPRSASGSRPGAGR